MEFFCLFLLLFTIIIKTILLNKTYFELYYFKSTQHATVETNH